jgi:hypothetical protein
VLTVQPIDFAEACAFVTRLHRHHRPPVGSKFQLAANDGGKVVGVLIAGRPVARHLDDGITAEVTRCCTDGTRNACSILYAAAWRAAKALGYWRMVTYTLPEEGGASLKAAGWACVGEAGGTPWNNNVRQRADDHPQGVKWRWEVTAGEKPTRFRLVAVSNPEPDLFAGVES